MGDQLTEKTREIENKLDYSKAELDELTEKERQELVDLYRAEINKTAEGVNLKPVKIKINKDMQKFMDPFDNVLEKLEGCIVYKHKARGYWPQGEGKVPECSSMDGITGTITETGETRECAGCPYNEWGSAQNDSGEKTLGKACKEMRRLYLEMEGYELPVLLTLPPTSINQFDSYISARMTRGTPDIFRETIIELSKEESHGYTYAVARFSIGDKVPPKKVLKLRQKRRLIKQSAKTEDLTQEDYLNIKAETENTVDLDDIT